ncbi:MAG: ATP-grasp fold amidoligase family protein [Butyricicoccus sp.]
MLNRGILALAHRGLLNWMPDKWYLQLMYKVRTGQTLHLKTPQTFNEKIQWLKLYDRRPEYTRMVDKLEAKQFASSLIGEEHIIPTIGVWERFDDITWDALPDQFVLKCTHDSGGLVICRDKKRHDWIEARKKIDASLKRNYFYHWREWPYKDVPPRIMAERLMSDEAEQTEGLIDYKFFCFHGEPKFLYVSQGLEDHATAAISFFDLNGDRLPFQRSDYREVEHFQIPSRLEEMKEIARVFASHISSPFVRIDLYEINGQVYFSEITFSPCGGALPFEPKHVDLELGQYIYINDTKKERV